MTYEQNKVLKIYNFYFTFTSVFYVLTVAQYSTRLTICITVHPTKDVTVGCIIWFHQVTAKC